MIINNNEVDLDEVLRKMNIKQSLLKDFGHGILLSDDEEAILIKYQINYKTCTNISQLIFMIEDYLNNSYEKLDELDNLSKRLAEYNYYQNTNK